MKNLQASVQELIVDPNEPELLTGKGLGYGIEFFIRKTDGKTGGWMSYTLSKAERDFQDFSETKYFTSRFDRRHDFKIFLYQRLNGSWKVSLNWLYGSPMPQLVAIDDPTSNLLPPYPQRPILRSNPYHRLDAAVSYILKKKKLV